MNKLITWIKYSCEKQLLYVLATMSIVTGCTDNTLVMKKTNETNIVEERIMKNIIVGDLGGVPVDLPRNSVHLVEYDGDPDWGEVRQGTAPKRTYQSKINSFGFDVRYTDGVLYDGIVGNMADEYDAQKNLPDSPWVSVGINSGNRYYGAGGIHRIGDGTINNPYAKLPVFKYKKLPEMQYGLEVYAPPGIDPETNRPWREDRHAEDVFIKRDKQGMIVSYIECSNRNVPRPPCTHYFSLEPKLGLNVYVGYSRHVLADWQQIEQVVKETISNFKK